MVTVSHAGYTKRVPLSAYRAQRRGGKGRSGMQTREEDFVSRLFVASTHTPVLFFSSRGQVYKEKVWRLPIAAPNSRGKALINILPLEQGERITTIMPLPEDESSWANLDVMFATTGGNVRRNKLSDFVDVRRSGIIAMKLDDGEEIVNVQICTERDDVLLTAAGGQCIRFPVTDVRVFTGRCLTGSRHHERLAARGVVRLPSCVGAIEAAGPGTREGFQSRGFDSGRRICPPSVALEPPTIAATPGLAFVAFDRKGGPLLGAARLVSELRRSRDAGRCASVPVASIWHRQGHGPASLAAYRASRLAG